MNEPAFPTVARDGSWQPHHDGMTLRDYFAAQALSCVDYMAGNPSVDEAPIIAAEAYRIADAMLAERAKGTP